MNEQFLLSLPLHALTNLLLHYPSTEIGFDKIKGQFVIELIQEYKIYNQLSNYKGNDNKINPWLITLAPGKPQKLKKAIESVFWKVEDMSDEVREIYDIVCQDKFYINLNQDFRVQRDDVEEGLKNKDVVESEIFVLNFGLNIKK